MKSRLQSARHAQQGWHQRSCTNLNMCLVPLGIVLLGRIMCFVSVKAHSGAKTFYFIFCELKISLNVSLVFVLFLVIEHEISSAGYKAQRSLEKRCAFLYISVIWVAVCPQKINAKMTKVTLACIWISKQWYQIFLNPVPSQNLTA